MMGGKAPESERDLAKMHSCDYIMNVNPQHPDNRYPNEFTIYSESWRMGGLPIEVWDSLTEDEQTPKLTKWWNPPGRAQFFLNKRAIAYWCQAGYGKENKRNNSRPYIEKLIRKLIDSEGYRVAQFGSDHDFHLFEGSCLYSDYMNSTVKRFNHLSFFEQIQLSLECDVFL